MTVSLHARRDVTDTMTKCWWLTADGGYSRWLFKLILWQNILLQSIFHISLGAVDPLLLFYFFWKPRIIDWPFKVHGLFKVKKHCLEGGCGLLQPSRNFLVFDNCCLKHFVYTDTTNEGSGKYEMSFSQTIKLFSIVIHCYNFIRAFNLSPEACLLGSYCACFATCWLSESMVSLLRQIERLWYGAVYSCTYSPATRHIK